MKKTVLFILIELLINSSAFSQSIKFNNISFPDSSLQSAILKLKKKYYDSFNKETMIGTIEDKKDLFDDTQISLIPSGIYINELMASNNSSLFSQTGESSDWVEIFNNTSQDLDLANYYLSDNKNNKTKFST